jgi:hypothetical protein
VWDAERFTNESAGTIDRRAGSNLNTANDFTTKELELPEYAEHVAIDADELINRIAGENPWDAASRSFSARFMEKMTKTMARMVAKVDVGVEVQAAQIMQTGQLALDGVKPYAADFLPKASHFVTVGIAWSNQATCTPLDDMESLAHQIKTDSRRRVRNVLMGRTALKEFLRADQVVTQADVRRMALIEIDPTLSDMGGSFYGTFICGSYEFRLWHYDETYAPFGGGAEVPYIDDDKVIMLPDSPGFVVGSVQVPRILPPDPRVAQLVTPPTTSRLGYDLTPNVWCSNEGNVVLGGIRAKVVLIPQEIDCFGALTT